MIKRFILTALIAAGLSAPAWARIDIRQNGDGTADYVGAMGSTLSCLGGVVLPADFAMSSLSSGAVVSTVTNALLRNIRVTRSGQTSGINRLTFWMNNHPIAEGATPVRFTSNSNTTVTQAMIQMFAGSISRTDVLSTMSEVSGANNLELHAGSTAGRAGRHSIEAGNFLIVQSAGSATSVPTTTHSSTRRTRSICDCTASGPQLVVTYQ